MKEVLYETCLRIDAAQIRPLTKVATMTGEGEILNAVCATMLSGHHVLYVMQQFTMVLV